jgi:hypothetical protein
VKYLLPTLTISTLLMTATAAFAARPWNLYLPSERFCAVYKGNIQDEQKFTLWVDYNQELTIKANPGLKVAVILQGKVLPAYQIAPKSGTSASQYAYRTSITGNHVIFIRGIARNATVTFCLK